MKNRKKYNARKVREKLVRENERNRTASKMDD